MGPVLEFFAENISGVDGACDAEDTDIDIDDGLADLAFAEIDFGWCGGLALEYASLS